MLLSSSGNVVLCVAETGRGPEHVKLPYDRHFQLKRLAQSPTELPSATSGLRSRGRRQQSRLDVRERSTMSDLVSFEEGTLGKDEPILRPRRTSYSSVYLTGDTLRRGRWKKDALHSVRRERDRGLGIK